MDKPAIKNLPGYLYPVADKKGEKHPDYTGKFNLNGKEFRLSGWKKQKDGKEMIVLSFTDPDELNKIKNNSGSSSDSQKNERTEKSTDRGSDRNSNNHSRQERQNNEQSTYRQNEERPRQPSPPPAPAPQSNKSNDGDAEFGDLFDNLS